MHLNRKGNNIFINNIRKFCKSVWQAGSGDFVKNFCFITTNSDGSNNISVDSNYKNVINHNRNCNGIDSDNVFRKALENTSVDMLSWSAFSGMKANPDKCHLLLTT